MRRNTKIVRMLSRIALSFMCVSVMYLTAYSQVCTPQLVKQWGSLGADTGQYQEPTDIALDTAGHCGKSLRR